MSGGTNVEIRPSTARDAPCVSEVLVEATEWTRELGHQLWTSQQLSVDEVSPDCAAGLFFVAWSGPVALGTMRLTESDPLFWPNAPKGEAIYLHRLAVRRSAAGGSVSTALLSHAVEVAGARGAAFLRLDCESNRPRLCQVYERFGFVFHSHRTVRGVHVVRYQLALAHVGQQS